LAPQCGINMRAWPFLIFPWPTAKLAGHGCGVGGALQPGARRVDCDESNHFPPDWLQITHRIVALLILLSVAWTAAAACRRAGAQSVLGKLSARGWR